MLGRLAVEWLVSCRSWKNRPPLVWSRYVVREQLRRSENRSYMTEQLVPVLPPAMSRGSAEPSSRMTVHEVPVFPPFSGMGWEMSPVRMTVQLVPVLPPFMGTGASILEITS